MNTVIEMKYRFSSEQCKEIEEARKANRDKQIEARLKVLALRSEGKGLKEIATETGFHRSYVSSLIKKYFDQGIESISQKHYTGNRRNMRFEEETQFLEKYRVKADQGHMIDLNEMSADYEKQVGHSISVAQIYRVLHRHGWRKVMPRSKHPKKAAPEAIEASKKLKSL